MLVDVISKNGNLLLSIPVRGNGTIDERERAILADIKEWMDQNSSSISGVRLPAYPQKGLFIVRQGSRSKKVSR